MTAPMRWIPDYVGVGGSIDFNTIKRQVMGHSVDQLAILIREFAQNSWDARAQGRSPVRFQVDGWTLTKDQQDALRYVAFADASQSGISELTAYLHGRRGKGLATALVLSDWGTKGLSGPLDPRQPVPARVEPRWTSYVHNVGKHMEGEEQGGAFGLGRNSSFGVSRCMGIVIYTRTLADTGSEESRLIAVAFGGPSSLKNRNLSGRHWWGRNGADGLALPVIGERADRIAALIGLPRRGLGELGLSVMILDPKTEAGLSETMQAIGESILWNLWPKMAAPRGGRRMEFSVSCEGAELPISNPTTHPVLKHYVASLEAVRGALSDRSTDPSQIGATKVFPVMNNQGKGRLMGYVAFTGLIAHSAAAEDDPDAAVIVTGRLPARPHHVMLARAPELVVTYKAFAQAPIENLGWAGVFRPLPELDNAFKLAEPVAHDAWEHSRIPNEITRDKSDVRFVMGPSGIARHVTAYIESLAVREPDRGQNLRRLSRMLTDQLVSRGDRKRDGNNGRDGDGASWSGSRDLGAIRSIRTAPEHEDGVNTTVWEGQWSPGRSAEIVELVMEIAPAGFARNEDPKDGMIIDPQLALISVEVDEDEIGHDRYKLVARLEGSRKLDIRVTIGRSANTAVSCKYHLRAAAKESSAQ